MRSIAQIQAMKRRVEINRANDPESGDVEIVDSALLWVLEKDQSDTLITEFLTD